MCAVSAPVFERDGSLKAVVTMVAPAERFGPRVRKQKVEALRSTAAETDQVPGGTGPVGRLTGGCGLTGDAR